MIQPIFKTLSTNNLKKIPAKSVLEKMWQPPDSTHESQKELRSFIRKVFGRPVKVPKSNEPNPQIKKKCLDQRAT
jgi:hypothetical protein